MNNLFSDSADLIAYFKRFLKHYNDFDTYFSPLSSKRMEGKYIANYDVLHKHSIELNQHYKLLLVIGTNGFDTWLNNYK